MSYRELLEAYKKGTLDENKKVEVEADIEKQDAISEYLFENAKIPGIEELDVTPDILSEKEKTKADDFTRLVNRRIRIAFIKASIITTLVALGIVAFCLKGLPKIIDNKYYNPLEQVGEKNNESTNKLTVDIATYTEAFMPTKNITRAEAISRGFGNYYISLFRNESCTYSGTLEKGKLRLYSPNALKRSIKLTYTANENGEGICYLTSPEGNDNLESGYIDYLNDYDYYNASVTLDKSMEYEEFKKWCEKNDVDPIWCAVNTDPGISNPNELPHKIVVPEANMYCYEPCFGFGADYLMGFDYDSEKYPTLSAMDTLHCYNEGRSEYDVAYEHVISMLNYLIDSYEVITQVIDDSEISLEDLQLYKKHIEQSGLYVYGFVIVENKEVLQKINELEDVGYVLLDERK